MEKKNLQVRIPRLTMDRLILFSKESGINKTLVVDQAIREYLDREEPKLKLILSNLKDEKNKRG